MIRANAFRASIERQYSKFQQLRRTRRRRDLRRSGVSGRQLESLESRSLLTATAWTDKVDYAEGEVAIINASGFALGETVTLQVLHTDGASNDDSAHDPWNVTDGGAGDNDNTVDGNILTSWAVPVESSTGSTFELTAVGQTSGMTASSTFIDHPTTGQIIVEKQTDQDGNTWNFEFHPSFAPNFILQDNQQWTSAHLTAGSYSISEILPASWNLTSIDVVSGDADGGSTIDLATCTINVDLDAGETIYIRYNNERMGKIIVEKQTHPDGSDVSFGFDGSWGTSFNLKDGETYDSGWLMPDTYTVEELPLLGGVWHLQSVSIASGDTDGGSSVLDGIASIDLDGGETIRVVYTNRKLSASVELDKQFSSLQNDADGSGDISVGDTIAYAFTVTNTGERSIGDLVLTDPLPGMSAITLSATTLAPAATATATATYVVTNADVAAGTILNTATVTGVAIGGDIVTDSDSETVTVGPRGRIIVEKQTHPDGSDVSFGFDGSWGTSFNLKDGETYDSGWLTPDTYTVEELPLLGGVWHLQSVSIASGDTDGGSTVLDGIASIDLDGGETIRVVYTNRKFSASISLDKQFDGIVSDVDGSGSVSAGDTIKYAFKVTNTGERPVSDLVLNDPLPGLTAITGDPSSWVLAPSESATFHATYMVTAADALAGTIVNTATVTGTALGGDSVNASDSVTIDVASLGRIVIVKNALPHNNTEYFEFDASWRADNFSLLDGEALSSDFLVPGSYTVTELFGPTSVWYLDSVGISGDPDDGSTIDWSTDSVTLDLDPGETITVVFNNLRKIADVTIDKKMASIAVDADLSGDISAGDTIIYSLTVTNSGEQPLSNISVTDPLPGLGPITGGATSLLPGASTEFTASYVVTTADVVAGGITNTATVNAVSLGNDAVSDTDTETTTVLQRGRIIVRKEAIPSDTGTSFGFDSSWGPDFELQHGQSHNSGLLMAGTYTVEELPLMPLFSGWTLQSVEVASGDLDGGSTISDSKATLDLDAGETITVVYTNRRLTASISLDKQFDGITVDADGSSNVTVGDTIRYAFVVTNTGELPLSNTQVVDPLPGLSVTDPAPFHLGPGATVTRYATYVVTSADVASGSINNTATVTGTSAVVGSVSDSDSESITLLPRGRIIVEKQTNPDGSTSEFTFTNSWTDPFILQDGEEHDSGSLAAGTYTIREKLPVPGVWLLDNIVILSGDTDGGSTTDLVTCTATIDLDPGEVIRVAFTNRRERAEVTIDKKYTGIVNDADGSGTVTLGDTIGYAFDVQNLGEQKLFDIVVSDPLPGLSAITGGESMLFPGQVATWTATYVVTSADELAGTLNNTATVNAVGLGGDLVSDTDSEAVTISPSARIIVEKVTDPAGADVAFSFNSSWGGDFQLKGGESLTSGYLAAGSYTVAEIPLEGGVWTFVSAEVASGDTDGGSSVLDATATIDLDPGETIRVVFRNRRLTESVEIDKTYTGIVNDADNSGGLSVGDVVGYSFTVTNTGELRLFDVAVVDPLPGLSAITGGADTLWPGQSTTFTATYTITQVNVDLGVISNTASAVAVALGGNAVADTDSESINLPQNPAVSIIKSVAVSTDADNSGTPSLGDTLTYTFTVSNTGDVTLTNLAVTDPLPGLSAITGGASSLAVGASTMFIATYTLTQADVDNGSIANTATVAALSPLGVAVSNSDGTTLSIPAVHCLVLEKSVALTTDVGQTGIGMNDTLTYTFKLTNVGNQTLTQVAIEDHLPALSAITLPSTTLAPGQSVTGTATYVVTHADADRGYITNVAKAYGNTPGGDPASQADDVYDADMVTVQVQALGKGCSADFWKNDAELHGAAAWPAGYSPDQDMSTVFANGQGITLLQMLNVGGGGVNALLRQGVAAVLNAAHPDVDYPLTVQQVVDLVNTARASGDMTAIQALTDQLTAYNMAGCDIDLHHDPVKPLHVLYGDANMDGQFDSADCVYIMQLGQYEDGTPFNSHWGSGDWNGDGEFNTSDFVVAFQQGMYEGGVCATPVAELAAAVDELYSQDEEWL